MKLKCAVQYMFKLMDKPMYTIRYTLERKYQIDPKRGYAILSV
jgi:hypothetical protein